MARPKSKKGAFDDLDPEYKSTLEDMSDDDVRRKISEVALNEAQNQENKKADQDLAEKKLAAKEAGLQYSEASKANRLRILYARFILEARGTL